MSKQRVLLTNDDGVSREGLRSLRASLIGLGLNVTVVAPAQNQSGRARAVSCFGPVEVEQLDPDEENPVFACGGTPVDCVRVAVLSDLIGSIDVIASGINHGVNLGDDSTLSGTLGAAIEGALLGVPSIALSQQDDAGDISLISHGRHIFKQVPFAAEMVRLRARADVPANIVFSLNIPHRLNSPEVSVTRLGHFEYPTDWSPAEAKGEGLWNVWPYMHPDKADPDMERLPGTDVAAVSAGQVSLTPIATDWSQGCEAGLQVAMAVVGEEATGLLAAHPIV